MRQFARTDEAAEEVEEMAREIARIEAESRKESASLSDLRPKGRQARTRTAKVGLVRKRSKAQIARKDLVSTREATAKQIVEIERRISALSTSTTELTAKRDDLKSKTGSPEARFRMADRDSGKTPIYLELHSGANGDTLLVHSPGTSIEPGTKIPVAEALARGGYLVKLGKKLARSGSGRYVMLLVRPGTTESFHAAMDCLRRSRAPFAYEPIDKSWRLVFK
jgi:hypothetical protein